MNAWHGAGPQGEEWTLGGLIRHLSMIGGLDRIRYTTSHPRDMDDELITAHGEVAELMPYLHLPVQSGSDRILAAMNRSHTAARYLEIMAQMRKTVPGIALASDFIVGFPGETDQDFEDTMALVREVNYASAYSFKYSIRPGTPAAEMFGQVPEEVKNERLQQLQALLREQQTAFNAAQIGKTLPILVTGRGRLAGQLAGRSPYLQAVHFDGPEGLEGQIVNVQIVGASLNSLTGAPVDSEAAA